MVDKTHKYLNLAANCANPPVPPSETNLVLIYVEGERVEFGEQVYYKCKPHHFFDESFERKNFSLTCNPDGSFDDPHPWKHCTHISGRT